MILNGNRQFVDIFQKEIAESQGMEILEVSQGLQELVFPMDSNYFVY